MKEHDSFLRETEQFFHEQIPITKAMEVRVETYDREKLVLHAPLDANHNHLGTAFGGSLGAIATLAGYGVLWLELGDRSVHIVVRDSSIQYLHPVRNSIIAICQRPDEKQIADFKTKFRKIGKARFKLKVTVEEDDRVCVAFEGTYIAIR